MKFYEVQPALEAGKKITHHNLRGKFISIEKEEANIFGKTLVLTISDYSRVIGYSLNMVDLFADDWEILEDIPEVKLFRSKEILYKCPRCGKTSEQLVYTEDRSETIHECHHCGQKFRFGNLEEMKDMYYGKDSKKEDKSIKELLAEAKALTGTSKTIDMSIDFRKFPEHTIYFWYRPEPIIKEPKAIN